MLYLIVILLSMVLISIIDCTIFAHIYNLSVAYVIIAVAVSTIIEILLSGLVAFIVRWCLPKRWFQINKKFFSATKKEKIFYDKICIKKWKDKIPELGSFTSFHKDKVREPNNSEYVERYIVEANYGVLIHFISVFVGFAVIFFYPLKFWYMFGLPVAIVGAILNLLPTFTLRYNLTKLHVLYKFNAKRKSVNDKSS